MSRYSSICGVWLALSMIIASGCGSSEDGIRPPSPSIAPVVGPNQSGVGRTAQMSGHQKMVAQLELIAERTAKECPFLGTNGLHTIRDRLAGLSDEAPAMDEWNLFRRAAMEEAKFGNEQFAIQRRSHALSLIDRLGTEVPPDSIIETQFRLGLNYLRLGETQNCCLRHNAQSCILPIQGDGVHTRTEGSTEAIKHFTKVLEATTSKSIHHLKVRWLLNIAYMTLGRYPEDVPAEYLIPPDVFASDEAFPRFENIAPRLGLNTFNLSGGVVIDDFDNDMYLDILTSSWEAGDQIRLFRNNRNGRFTERTEQAGLTGLYGGLNMVQADYDNDGDVDVYVLRGAWRGELGRSPNSLLRNNGNGTFTDVTFDVGLGDLHYPTQTAAWADYDNDGNVDLYVGNELSNGDAEAITHLPCQLFRNNADGTFTDVAAEAGVENRRFPKAVVWGDYDGDRYPDLFISNLGQPNRLYRNNADGTFTDVAPRLGVTKPYHSFPSWFWDFNNDGKLDLYVSGYNSQTDMVALVAASYLGHTVGIDLAHLFRGDGRGGFADVAQKCNLTRLNLPMGSNFGDLDNDGFLDFYLGTGYPDYESLMPNVMYRNQQGQAFADVTTAGGFGHLQKGHAIAFADLDNDGDQDIYEQMGGALLGDKYYDALYENPGFENHWITIKLVGTQSNRGAIGARIRAEVLENGIRRSIYKHVNSGGSFGANPLRQTIGLGKAAEIEVLEIYWPTSHWTQVFRNVDADQMIRIVEAEEKYTQMEVEKLKLGSGTLAL